MNNNLQAELQSVIGRGITVYLQLTDGSTGRTGKLGVVGVDYLVMSDGTLSYLIPFHAITHIEAH
jgi:hypothetical protein